MLSGTNGDLAQEADCLDAVGMLALRGDGTDERDGIHRRLVDGSLVVDVAPQFRPRGLATVRVTHGDGIEQSRHIGRRAVRVLQAGPRDGV